MAEAAALPSRQEAMGWVGAPVAEIGGARIGDVQGFFFDSAAGEPAWLIVQLGRRRRTRLVAVPLRDCAGAPFGVWIAHDGDAIRTAPAVDPTRPLRREHELTICAHFGIGDGVGRAAEVREREEGAATSAPASA